MLNIVGAPLVGVFLINLVRSELPKATTFDEIRGLLTELTREEIHDNFYHRSLNRKNKILLRIKLWRTRRRRT